MKAILTRFTQKGQVLVPVKLRRSLGIRNGTPAAVFEEDRRIILQPITPEYVARVRGSLKGTPSILKILLKERKKERTL